MSDVYLSGYSKPDVHVISRRLKAKIVYIQELVFLSKQSLSYHAPIYINVACIHLFVPLLSHFCFCKTLAFHITTCTTA